MCLHLIENRLIIRIHLFLAERKKTNWKLIFSSRFILTIFSLLLINHKAPYLSLPLTRSLLSPWHIPSSIQHVIEFFFSLLWLIFVNILFLFFFLYRKFALEKLYQKQNIFHYHFSTSRPFLPISHLHKMPVQFTSFVRLIDGVLTFLFLEKKSLN